MKIDYKKLTGRFEDDQATKFKLKESGLSEIVLTEEIIKNSGAKDIISGRKKLINYLSIPLNKIRITKQQKGLQEELQDRLLKKRRQKQGEVLTALSLNSPIEILVLIPEFEKWIKETREKYNIKPHQLKREREKLFKNEEMIQSFGRASFDSSYFIGKRGAYRRLLYGMEFKKISDWENKRIPYLDIEIIKYRTEKMKLPTPFDKIIKTYILYNEKLGTMEQFLENLKPLKPSITLEVDKDKKEPCVTMRIYANTIKRDIKNYLKEIYIQQKSLKELFPLSCIKKKGLLPLFRQALWYFARKRKKMTPMEANKIINYLGFREINYKKDDAKIVNKFEGAFMQ